MRSISWKTYAAAFLISAFVFGIGILVGVFLTQSTSQGLQLELEALSGRTGQIELLLLANTTLSNLCPFYQKQQAQFDVQTSDFGSKLQVLEESRGRADSAVQRLKREYMVQQVRDFLLVERINVQCGAKTPTLLYFYQSPCPECTRQGLEALALKKKRPDVMVYALDVDLKTPAVEALKELHGVNGYPTLVVNGKTAPGFQTLEKIESLLS